MNDEQIVDAWREKIVKKHDIHSLDEDDWHSLWKGFVFALDRPDLITYRNYMRLGYPVELEIE